MNDFYTSAIQNIVVQSKLPEPLPVRQTQQQQQQQQQPAAGESLEFGELLPLLNKISDPSYALTGARWLAENLHGEENKRRALETALEVARKTREQAGSEVKFELCLCSRVLMFLCFVGSTFLIDL